MEEGRDRGMEEGRDGGGGGAKGMGGEGEKEDERTKERVEIPPSSKKIIESRIGHFSGAILPNIRKFSYFPKYVEENKFLFENKKVRVKMAEMRGRRKEERNRREAEGSGGKRREA
jgi:hypothetical protein